MNQGTSAPKKLTPRDLEWIQRQLLKPNPIFLVSELVTLTGGTTSTRQLRRWLIRKGVLEQRPGQRRNHLVALSRLKALWPEFWLSVKAAWSEGGLNRRRVVDDDEDEAA